MPLPKDECAVAIQHTAGAIQHTAGALQHAISGFLARMLDG
jgi:hypothetical protein